MIASAISVAPPNFSRTAAQESPTSSDARVFTLDVNNARRYVLEDLRVPPGNQLEALKGDRKGQFSIRINDQWRLCFVWTAQGARDVEIVDYH